MHVRFNSFYFSVINQAIHIDLEPLHSSVLRRLVEYISVLWHCIAWSRHTEFYRQLMFHHPTKVTKHLLNTIVFVISIITIIKRLIKLKNLNSNIQLDHHTGNILGMSSANEKKHYMATPPFIEWAHTQNDPCSGAAIYIYIFVST